MDRRVTPSRSEPDPRRRGRGQSMRDRNAATMAMPVVRAWRLLCALSELVALRLSR